MSGYAELLQRWQRRINLVSRASLVDLWRRHMLDSAQLWPLAPPGARVWVDLGSGAGFPGLVLAILGAPEMHLIESDARKCAFLREAARLTGTHVRIHNTRIEAVAPFHADVVTARALAPLRRLLTLAQPFLDTESVALCPKGRHVENELTDAARSWRMVVDRVPSRSDPSGTVLVIKEISGA